MLKRALSLVVIIALGGGVFGAGAYDGSGAEANMPLCCKKARSAANAPEVSIARLCCKLNCAEPGSGGLTNASSVANQGTSLARAIVPTPACFSGFALRNVHTHEIHSHKSNPRYIQHLALLI